MRLFLTVDPDAHEWRAADELGSTIARGSWSLNARSEVVSAIVERERGGRRSAKDRRQDEMFCRAVVACVHAMRAHA
jgi:hypothetical protein